VEEVDLTQYFDALIRKWWLIVGLTVVCALVAGVYAFTRPSFYQARALVATVKEVTQVSFSQEIKTLSEDEIDPQVSRAQRLRSFVAMASSPAIAEAVLAQLGDQLPAQQRSTRALLGMVRANIPRGTDLIEIVATHPNPSIAEMVANAWAQEYIRQLNEVYSSRDETSYEAVEKQLADAKRTYEEAQKAWETLLEESRLADLQRRINEYEGMLESLSQSQGQSVQCLLHRLQYASWLLQAAEDMRSQLLAGGEGAARSNSSALMLLKVQAFALAQGQSCCTAPVSSAESVPSQNTEGGVNSAAAALLHLQVAHPNTALQLQAQLGSQEMTQAEALKDLAALIRTLKTRKQTLQTELAQVLAAGEQGQLYLPDVTNGEAGLQQSVSKMEEQLRRLRAELAREEARQKEVQARLNLAWESYNALSRTLTELEIALHTKGAQARLAAPAIVEHNGTISKARTVALGAVVGIILGIILTYLVEFIEGYREREAARRARSS